ncbi:hypothetical protein T09_4767 [Trichinella sp. T9]|nr:hypothetical protein T09_4767 [Trichinella sp. T9]
MEALSIIFNQLNCVNKKLNFNGHKCYYNQQLLLAGCIIKRAGFDSISDVPTRIALLYNFFAISRQILVCTTCDQLKFDKLEGSGKFHGKLTRTC